MNPGGSGLEQSPCDCGDGRGDNGLTPAGAGSGRAPGSPIPAETPSLIALDLPLLEADELASVLCRAAQDGITLSNGQRLFALGYADRLREAIAQAGE